jgi:hypothetical protein
MGRNSGCDAPNAASRVADSRVIGASRPAGSRGIFVDAAQWIRNARAPLRVRTV